MSPALWHISTQWSQVDNPSHFVLRYAEAIRRYLIGWLHDHDAADEVLQQLLLQVTDRGFKRVTPDRGRFRDYLIAMVRNAARRWHRPRRDDTLSPTMLRDLADPRDAEAAWRAEWRTCLIERAFRALHAHEIETPGNLYHSVLRLVSDRPDDDQANLAAQLGRRLDCPISHDAFRKTLSRARREFAVLLLREVALTLESPTAADVEEELSSLELFTRVSPYLPENWRTDGKIFFAAPSPPGTPGGEGCGEGG